MYDTKKQNHNALFKPNNAVSKFMTKGARSLGLWAPISVEMKQNIGRGAEEQEKCASAKCGLYCRCSVSCVFITYSGSGKWMIDTINHSHPRRLTGLTSSRVSITKVPKPRKSVLLYLCSVPCVSRQNINIPRQWWATLWPSDLASHASRLTTYRVSLHQSPRIKDIWTICQDVSTHD